MRWLIVTALILMSVPAFAGDFSPPKDKLIPSYEQMARTPSKYIGKHVLTGGRVFQVLEEDGITILLIQSETRSSVDTIIVRYKNPDPDTRILEDDRVVLWGDFIGLHTYETALRISRTVPLIDAKELTILPPKGS